MINFSRLASQLPVDALRELGHVIKKHGLSSEPDVRPAQMFSLVFQTSAVSVGEGAHEAVKEMLGRQGGALSDFIRSRTPSEDSRDYQFQRWVLAYALLQNAGVAC